MAASSAHIEWHANEEQALVIEVETEADRPDALDDIAHRAAWLLTESLAAIAPAVADDADHG